RVIIGLFPELDAPGGVQRASRHVAAVLSEFASTRAMESRILSLNDTPALHRMSVGEREFVFTGCERGKVRLLTTAVRMGRQGAKLVVVGDPNLAPVARAMRLFAPKMKTIVCTHGLEVWTPLPGLRRQALRSANLVLAPSHDTAAQVAMNQNVPENRIRVLPWALDPQFEKIVAGSPQTALPANFPQGHVVL